MREVMYYLASTMHVNHAHKLRGPRWANEQSSFDDMKAKVPETMAASCTFLEPQITGPYLFGPEPTLADCYLYPITTWLAGDGVDITGFPKLAAWKATMETRVSVRRAAEDGFVG
jgi:glutathione S-transferase